MEIELGEKTVYCTFEAGNRVVTVGFFRDIWNASLEQHGPGGIEPICAQMCSVLLKFLSERNDFGPDAVHVGAATLCGNPVAYVVTGEGIQIYVVDSLPRAEVMVVALCAPFLETHGEPVDVYRAPKPEPVRPVPGANLFGTPPRVSKAS